MGGTAAVAAMPSATSLAISEAVVGASGTDWRGGLLPDDRVHCRVPVLEDTVVLATEGGDGLSPAPAPRASTWTTGGTGSRGGRGHHHC